MLVCSKTEQYSGLYRYDTLSKQSASTQVTRLPWSQSAPHFAVVHGAYRTSENIRVANFHAINIHVRTIS